MGDTSWLPWTDSNGNRGEVRPLVVSGLTASLLRKLLSLLTIRPFTLKNMSYRLNRDELPILIAEMRNSDRIFSRFTLNLKGNCSLPTAKNPVGT